MRRRTFILAQAGILMIDMRPLQRFTVLVSIIALTAMSFPAPLYGQRGGERLRVTLDGETMTGTVSATSQSGFDLRLWGGKSRSIVHSEIELLEQSLGTQTYKKRGFAIGFGAGALGGLFLSLAVGPYCTPHIGCDRITTAEAILGSTVLGTYLGLTGLVIGAIVRSEEWEAIPTPFMSGVSRISPVLDVALDQRRNPIPVLRARILF